MKLKVLGSACVKKELYFAAAHSTHDIDIEFFDCDAKREDVQSKIDSEAEADYIILALDEDILEGIIAAARPVVVPRIHNCAQLILGSRERFYKIFNENDDSPCWLDCYGKFPPNGHGCPCYIGGELPVPVLPQMTREYIGDLGFLRGLLSGKWYDNAVFILNCGERIIKDPVEILDKETF